MMGFMVILHVEYLCPRVEHRHESPAEAFSPELLVVCVLCVSRNSVVIS